MSTRNIDLLAGLERAMKGLTHRQKITAANIANADTPGFKARDVRLPSFAALVSAKAEAAGAQGEARPMVDTTETMDRLRLRRDATVPDRAISETKADGNNVTIETQMLRLSDIQTSYAAAAGLYRKSIGILRTALGRTA